ncbi:hypothetical protein MAR_031333 [Mya arenaria]|uniref:Uncharacterized protein n=1 Tax=Mya arenaria TaxID=6604 RepID=A0ABY7F5U2_MYAAR|nr:hypothetical protein MAR_031333 [Mya arenaria]
MFVLMGVRTDTTNLAVLGNVPETVRLANRTMVLAFRVSMGFMDLPETAQVYAPTPHVHVLELNAISSSTGFTMLNSFARHRAHMAATKVNAMMTAHVAVSPILKVINVKYVFRGNTGYIAIKTV